MTLMHLWSLLENTVSSSEHDLDDYDVTLGDAWNGGAYERSIRMVQHLERDEGVEYEWYYAEGLTLCVKHSTKDIYIWSD